MKRRKKYFFFLFSEFQEKSANVNLPLAHREIHLPNPVVIRKKKIYWKNCGKNTAAGKRRFYVKKKLNHSPNILLRKKIFPTIVIIILHQNFLFLTKVFKYFRIYKLITKLEVRFFQVFCNFLSFINKMKYESFFVSKIPIKIDLSTRIFFLKYFIFLTHFCRMCVFSEFAGSIK